MIITEKIELNGIEYIRTYSDEGLYIERDGVKYGEAIDPIGYDRTYTETNESTGDDSEELTPEEFQAMIEEVL